jgi:hypothetical protein
MALIAKSLGYLSIAHPLALHRADKLVAFLLLIIPLGALPKRSKGYTCARGLEVKSIYDK